MVGVTGDRHSCLSLRHSKMYRLTLLVPLFFCLAAAARDPEIRAGAAREQITPDLKKHEPVYMAGFGNNRWRPVCTTICSRDVSP